MLKRKNLANVYYSALSSQSLHAPAPPHAGQSGSVLYGRPERACSCRSQCSKLHASLQKFQFTAVAPQLRHSVVQSSSLSVELLRNRPMFLPFGRATCSESSVVDGRVRALVYRSVIIVACQRTPLRPDRTDTGRGAGGGQIPYNGRAPWTVNTSSVILPCSFRSRTAERDLGKRGGDWRHRVVAGAGRLRAKDPRPMAFRHPLEPDLRDSLRQGWRRPKAVWPILL